MAASFRIAPRSDSHGENDTQASEPIIAETTPGTQADARATEGSVTPHPTLTPPPSSLVATGDVDPYARVAGQVRAVAAPGGRTVSARGGCVMWSVGDLVYAMPQERDR